MRQKGNELSKQDNVCRKKLCSDFAQSSNIESIETTSQVGLQSAQSVTSSLRTKLHGTIRPA